MDRHTTRCMALVQVPEVEGNEVLQGQVLAVEVAGLTDSLGTFKARLAEVHTRLLGKQQRPAQPVLCGSSSWPCWRRQCHCHSFVG